jgi:hypothetical protein
MPSLIGRSVTQTVPWPCIKQLRAMRGCIDGNAAPRNRRATRRLQSRPFQSRRPNPVDDLSPIRC